MNASSPGAGERGADSALRIRGVPNESRGSLRPILDQSFTGLYRWHAKKTLASIRWVTEAVRGDAKAGVAMFTMLGARSGYIYYLAVIPALRAGGVGGLLLDDALRQLLTSGATEAFACARTDNIPSIGLLRSRDFVRTGFRELAASKGFPAATRLWMKMVVAPGEKVFLKVFGP